jgi:putative DNA primase/helicase
VTAPELLPRLRGARRCASGWMARCPAHEDRSPSLSVCERQGRVLIHCFAGCSTEMVCDALGIKMCDLFVEPRPSRKPEPPIVRAVERQIAGLRSRLTPHERERPVTVVRADAASLNAALARAIALAVEGEIVQVVDGTQ